LNLERSSDSSGLEGGRKFGRAPYVRVSMVSSGRAMRVWYGPLELTDVRENARLEPLVYRQTLFVLNKADWQLRRIEDMVGCMATFYSAWAPQSPEIWRKRVKRAKPRRPSPPPTGLSSHDSSLKVTQPHRGPLFSKKRNVSPKEDQPLQLALPQSEEELQNGQRASDFLAESVHRQESTHTCQRWTRLWRPDEVHG